MYIHVHKKYKLFFCCVDICLVISLVKKYKWQTVVYRILEGMMVVCSFYKLLYFPGLSIYEEQAQTALSTTYSCQEQRALALLDKRYFHTAFTGIWSDMLELFYMFFKRAVTQKLKLPPSPTSTLTQNVDLQMPFAVKAMSSRVQGLYYSKCP